MTSTLLLQATAPPSAAPPSAAPPSAAPPPSAGAPSGSGSTQAPGSSSPSGPFGALCGGGQGSFPLMMVLMIAVFYFILIRPQQKKQKETESWLKSLKKGDEVVTSGGVIGRISGLTDNTVTLEVQEKVRIKVLRSSVSGKAPGTTTAATTEPEKK
ncbi:MAG TPA: preprotein translocase subunit YajC [Polyangia bacterium]|nr:preprotein translocase subunit YajC [Polyangia bacterium]